MNISPSPNNFSTEEFKNQFNIRTILLIMVMILLLTIIFLWNPLTIHKDAYPIDTHMVQITSIPAGKQAKKAISISTEEWNDYQEQTNRIVLGSVVMVLIIIGGSLSVIQKKEK